MSFTISEQILIDGLIAKGLRSDVIGRKLDLDGQQIAAYRKRIQRSRHLAMVCRCQAPKEPVDPLLPALRAAGIPMLKSYGYSR